MTEVTKKIRAGVYGIVFNQGSILLVTQNRGPYQDKYDLPGGGVEFGEELEEALRREFQEELNMDFKKSSLLGNFSNCIDESSLKFHQIGMLYKVEGLFTLQTPPHEDFLPYQWYDVTTLSQEQVTPLVWKALQLCPKSA